MTLKHDTSTAAKMVACSELIRRLEHSSIGEVLPETAAALGGRGPGATATAYIKIDDDGPREYEVETYDESVGRREEDDVHPQSFAFAITVPNGADTPTDGAIGAARARLAGLIRIHEAEQ